MYLRLNLALDNQLCIGYSKFCVGYGIYTREPRSECLFDNHYKTLYYLFSPDPAVSCVGDKLVSHREIYTLCSLLLHLILEFVIFLAMDAFTWFKCILIASFLLEFFYQNYLGCHGSLIKRYRCID